MNSLVNILLELASREVGTREEGGNNRGKRVEEYLASVNLTRGNPWCAAFVSWCFQKANIKGWPSSGDTWAFRLWAKNEKCYTNTPSVGDVFLLLDSAGNPMHAGFVTDVHGQMIHTIEGNTGSGSDTDGDGVFSKVRPITDCKYVHWQSKLALTTVEKKVKAFWHDGIGSVIIDNKSYTAVGVKINGVPWAGGDILIAYKDV